MKVIIYTKSETRQNLIQYMIFNAKSKTKIDIEYVSSLSVLADTLLRDEYKIIGCIFDFDGESYKDLDKFLLKIKDLHATLYTLATSPYKLNTHPCFKVTEKSYEELLLSVNNFIFNCQPAQRYTYKLVIKNGKCYLKESFGIYETSLKDIWITDFSNDCLEIKFEDKIDVVVIKRMFASNSLSNFFGNVTSIKACDNKKCHTFFKNQTIAEMEKCLNK